jgi:hypothetical protein
MQPIGAWLEKLGMSEYADRFAEHRIDFSVLRDLTDQDLKELASFLATAGSCCAPLPNSMRPLARQLSMSRRRLQMLLNVVN